MIPFVPHPKHFDFDADRREDPDLVNPDFADMRSLNDHELLQYQAMIMSNKNDDAARLIQSGARFKRFLGQFKGPFGQFADVKEAGKLPNWLTFRQGSRKTMQFDPPPDHDDIEWKDRLNDRKTRLQGHRILGVEGEVENLLPFRDEGDIFEYGEQDKNGIHFFFFLSFLVMSIFQIIEKNSPPKRSSLPKRSAEPTMEKVPERTRDRPRQIHNNPNRVHAEPRTMARKPPLSRKSRPPTDTPIPPRPSERDNPSSGGRHRGQDLNLLIQLLSWQSKIKDKYKTKYREKSKRRPSREETRSMEDEQLFQEHGMRRLF